MRLANNYEKITREGTAIILLSKHISCVAIDKLSVGMNFIFYNKINMYKNMVL